MKLSKQTLAIIKNFSQINSNLLIKPGNTLSTISPSKHLFGEAQIEESFDTEFGIYDLSEWLSVLSIFNDPDVEIDGKVMYITEGKNKVRYISSETAVLISPKTTPKFPADCDVSFELTMANLQQISRAASVLKVPFISIVGNGESITIIVTDKNNPNSNQFQIEVGSTDLEFTVNIKVELLKMMPETYEFNLSAEHRRCKLVGQDKSYQLAWEIDSVFNK